MNGTMVRATLRLVDPKTQTRRLLKQAVGPSLSVDCEDGIATLSWLHGEGPGYPMEETVRQVACPYGVPGDRLWVRESFWGCDGAGWGDTPCVVYDDEWHGKHYQAAEIRPWAPKFGRIPSIHMPRACSRITLEVTGVRVERLQEISPEDSIAEGIEFSRASFMPQGFRLYDQAGKVFCTSPIDSYRSLWDSLKPARGAAWADNPWVWVVEFKRVAP